MLDVVLSIQERQCGIVMKEVTNAYVKTEVVDRNTTPLCAGDAALASALG